MIETVAIVVSFIISLVGGVGFYVACFKIARTLEMMREQEAWRNSPEVQRAYLKYREERDK